MANTYDINSLDTNRNKVRLLIKDTNTTAGEYLFEDQEIDAFLSIVDSDLYQAAGLACRAVATDKAKSAIATKLLGDEMDLKSVSDRYLRLAQEFERKSDSIPASFSTTTEDQDLEFVDHLTGRDHFEYEEHSE